MNCHNCAQSLREGAKFCPKCGAVVKAVQTDATPAQAEPTATSTNKCPKCGHNHAPDAKFCANCRSRIGETPASENSVPVAVPSPRPATPPARPAAMPGGFVGRKTAASKGSRILKIGILAVIVLAAAAGYWWFNRPPGPYKFDNSGLYPIYGNAYKSGFMDKTGKTVIDPQFDQTNGFSEGLAAVMVGTKWGFIDTKGNIAITPQFDWVNSFREGFAPAMIGNRWGYIDKDGKYIRTPDLLLAEPFSDGLAKVNLANQQYAFMKRSGELVFPGKFDNLGTFHEGLAPAASRGKYGFINLSGEWVIDPQYEQAWSFTEGLAPVLVGGRWGYIDRKGKFAINPQFDGVTHFSEGYARYWSSGKCGFIDIKGKKISDAVFKDARDFSSEGLAPVWTEEGWGFIDTTGKMAIAVQFDSAESFQNGLARVTALGKEAYITKTGSFVVNPFPGTTIAAERARLAAEAAKVAQAEHEAQKERQSRFAQSIVGEWAGAFGGDSAAKMTITRNGDTIAAVLLTKGWREVFSVGLSDDNRLGLTGTSVTKVNSSAYGSYNLDTMALQLSSDGSTLTGEYRDTRGPRGTATFRKNIELMDERERPEDAVREETTDAQSSATLTGKWRDENSVTSYSGDGTYTAKLDDGNVYKGTWAIQNGTLVLQLLELNGKSLASQSSTTKQKIVQLSYDKFVSKSSRGAVYNAYRVK